MNEKRLHQAGSALTWRAIQLAGTKLVNFVRLLILARLLVPDDFGLLAIAVTGVGFFASVTDLGMIPALVQGREIDEKWYDTAWTIGLARALGITVIVALFAPLIGKIFAEPRSVDVIRVLALGPLLEALASIKVASLMRNLQFRPLAILRTVEAVVGTIVSIVLAVSFGVWALVAGVLAGAAANTVLSYVLVPHRPRLSFDRHSSRMLIRFGQWIFVTGLIAMLGQYVLRVVISRQLGAAALGLYVLAAQLAYLPSEISSGVVGSVAFPLFARLQTDIQQARRAFRTMVVGMAVLLYPVCLMMIALARPFVVEVLGAKWNGTEPVIQILVLATVIGIFGDAVVETLNGLGRPEKRARMTFVLNLTLISLVWMLSSNLGIIGAALAWLPAIIASQIVGIVSLRQVLPQPLEGLGRPLLIIAIASLAGAATAYGITRYLSGIGGLVAAGLTASLVTFLLLWISGRGDSMGFIQDVITIFPRVGAFLRIPEVNVSK
jgi:O-antigen/teichoic acid export membrane protein